MGSEHGKSHFGLYFVFLTSKPHPALGGRTKKGHFGPKGTGVLRNGIKGGLNMERVILGYTSCS
jgi:hypothetical protein